MIRTLACYGILLSALMLCCCSLEAQWLHVSTDIPYGTGCFDTLGNRLYVGQRHGKGGFGGTLSWTEDAGATWNYPGYGIIYYKTEISLATIGNVLVAGTESDGTYFSTDSGVTWQAAIDTAVSPLPAIIAMVAHSGYVFGGTKHSGIYRSSDSGRNWTLSDSEGSAYCFAEYDSLLFAGGSFEQVYRSSNDGNTWQSVRVSSDPALQDSIRSRAVIGRIVFAATTNGLFRSTDLGLTWARLDTTIFWYRHIPFSLLTENGNVIVGMEGAILRSSDSGMTWQPFDEGWPVDEDASFLIAVGNYLFAGSGYFSGLWRRPLLDLAVAQQLEAQRVSLSIFPNPASEQLHILPGPSGTIQLFDLLGRLRVQAKDDGSGAVLDVSPLAAGTYLLKVGKESVTLVITHSVW